MDRLTFLKGERSSARKELKNYLIMFRDDIAEECSISFPSKKEIKQYTSDEFDSWFMSIFTKLKEKISEDLVLIELIECYICSVNNVASAEEIKTNNMYY